MRAQAAAERARALLKARVKELHLIAAGLQTHETLSGEDIAMVLRGEQPASATAAAAGR